MPARMSSVYQITLCFLVLYSVQCITSANEISKIPHEGCLMEKFITDFFTCHSVLKYTTSNEKYIPDDTLCISNRGEVCMSCQEHSMVEVDCPSVTPLERRKRGFFKKLFRKVRPRINPLKHVKKIARKIRPITFGKIKPGKINIGNLKIPNFSKLKGGWNWNFKTRNTPPTIICPSVSSEITAPPGAATAKVTWNAPKVSDKENNIRSTELKSGKPSGSQFGPGRHTITYKTTDDGGLFRYCSVSFTVKVIRCPRPKHPANGVVQCSGTVGTVYGSKCTYRCNTGYQLSRAATTTCQVNGVFSSAPTCQKILCGQLSLPPHAHSSSCTDGNRFQSVCVLSCKNGYSPARQARSECSLNETWIHTAWKCEDTAKPVFTNCPSKKINTIDKKFQWVALKVLDNSGKVNLTQVQGQPPGSPLAFGAQMIKYAATDAAGNTAYCMFSVELKRTDCPKPTTKDPDMKFRCNGMTAQSVCQLSCESGSLVQGSKYIACVQDETENNTSYWEPINGEKARCFKKSCPDLNIPKNGALTCDKELGGTVCQIHCDDRYDVAPGEGTTDVYICGKDSGVWHPSNFVPDCLEIAYPYEYYLPTEYFYFVGDCTDDTTLRAIKQQFIDNLNSIGLSPCMSEACAVDDVEVACGDIEDVDDFDFRRKREASSHSKQVVHVRLRFHLKNSNRTISPEAAGVLLQSLVEKSKNIMSTNMVMRKLLPRPVKPTVRTEPDSHVTRHRKISFSVFKSKSSVPGIARHDVSQRVLPTVIPVKLTAKSVTGTMSTACAAGSVQLKSGVCVPCSVGTYHDSRSKTCKLCPINTFQTEPGSTLCQRCPLHHVTSSTGSVRRNDCKALCAIDTFSLSGIQPCYPCPQNSYQPNYGAKTCLSCPESKVDKTLLSKCLTVPQNGTISAPELQISEFLITCDKEVCLSF